MREARRAAYTYFVPDVAYHVTKWERGFTRAINVQGADHHSTVTRVRAGLQALDMGIPQGYPEYVLHQMVTVMRGGEEVKISKRAGSYVTVRDLIDEVGPRRGALLLPDAARATRSSCSTSTWRSAVGGEPGLLHPDGARAASASMLEQWRTAHPDEPAAVRLAAADLTPLVEPRELALARAPRRISRRARGRGRRARAAPDRVLPARIGRRVPQLL